MTDDDREPFFFCDGYTDDGQTVPVTVTHAWSSTHGDMRPIKVPLEELAIDPENTIHVDLTGEDQ